MKHINSRKQFEELDSSTYLSAADKLAKLGHKKRPIDLRNWSNIITAKQLGKYDMLIGKNVVECYIVLKLDIDQLKEDYESWKSQESSTINISFNLGIMPINIEDLPTTWTNLSKDSPIWVSYFEVNFTSNAERYGGNTSHKLLTDNEIKIPIDSNELLDIAIPSSYCHLDHNQFANRKSAVRFKKVLIDIFSGEIIYNPTSENPGGLKGILMDELCSERDFSIYDFIRFIKSLSRINVNTLYKD
jgi:hypothetical protein